MKKITDWIANNKKLNSIRWFLIKHSTTISFKIIARSRHWNQQNYDNNIIELYKGVKQRKAFVFKTKVMSPGKGITHYKFLFVETPQSTIMVKLMKRDHPDFFKDDNHFFKHY
jgi:hypothetical protein